MHSKSPNTYKLAIFSGQIYRKQNGSLDLPVWMVRQHYTNTMYSIFSERIRMFNLKLEFCTKTTEKFVLIISSKVHQRIREKNLLIYAPYNICNVGQRLTKLFINEKKRPFVQKKCTPFVAKYIFCTT